MSALTEALVAAQAELPCAIGKDADGQIQNRTYRYLTLDKLIAETRPILQKHGLTIMQWPSYMPRGDEGAAPVLKTTLYHVSGEMHGEVCARLHESACAWPRNEAAPMNGDFVQLLAAYADVWHKAAPVAGDVVFAVVATLAALLFIAWILSWGAGIR